MTAKYFADVKSVQILDHPKNFKTDSQRHRQKKEKHSNYD